MECPYSDCAAKGLKDEHEICPACRRPNRSCEGCNSAVRAFARFCSACGKPLAGGALEWSGFRGGPRRLGMNPTQVSPPLLDCKLLPVDLGYPGLGDPCYALLSWDRHLIAVSEAGWIQIVAPGTTSRARFKADGPMSSQPCIERSVLFLGHRGGLMAYYLGTLVGNGKGPTPYWRLPVAGRPMGPLLALGGRLFAVIQRADGQLEVCVVERAGSKAPLPPRTLFTSRRLSTLVGDWFSRQVSFLAQDNDRVDLLTIDTNREPLHVERHPVRDLTSDSRLGRPSLAVMGSMHFVVLEPGERLFRIEAGKASVRLAEDVQRFAMNRSDQWAQINATGLSLPHLQAREDLTHMDRVLGQPVILRNWGVALGLQNGRVRLHDLHHPHQNRELRVEPPEHGITALASFSSFIAAGSSRGTVALFEVVPS